jgi:O-antigen ligase
MSPTIATFVCFAGIIALWWLDRDQKLRTSPALWIAILWFLLACSRPLGAWLADQSHNEAATEQVAEGSAPDRAALSALLLLGLIVLFKRKRLVLKSLRQSLPILIFFAYCLISLMWSDFPAIAFKRWNKAVGDFVMVLLIWTDPDPVGALKRLLARVSYILIPISVLFIKYYPDLGRTYDYLGGAHYIGVTREKNTLGSLCLLLGIAAIWRIVRLFSEERQTAQRWRRLIPQFVIVTMIVWMFSILDAMTSLSCFLLANCVLFATRLRMVKRSRILVHVLMLSIILIPVSVTVLGMSPDTLQRMGRNPTLTDRTDIWKAVVKLNPNPWVGAGFESFWAGPRLQAIVDTATRWWVPNQAHNGYLEIYANLGWLGVGCLLIVIVWAYGGVVRAWRQRQPACHLMLAFFLSGVIFNLTEAAFFRMMIPIWLFFLIAITSPISKVKQISTERIRKSLGSKTLNCPATRSIAMGV